jgi:hypothetical protein
MGGLNFGGRDELAQLAKQTTNPIQINDYNSLRRSRTSMYFPDNRKQSHTDTKSFALHNDLLDTKSPSRQLINSNRLSSRRRECQPGENCYKSADGTVYKRYVDENNIVTEHIDPPTKNVIHVRGKYHEQYRQSADFEEIPQNIKHKFGTNNTRELLKDEVKVHDTLAKIYNDGVNKKQNRENEEVTEIRGIQEVFSRGSSRPTDPHKDYNELGNLLRHAVQRGQTTVYDMGHIKEWHNEEVSKLYLSDKKNIDSPYRRKTDWLSKFSDLLLTPFLAI